MNASLIEALGWTLLHSLWQGCAVALLLRLALHLLRRHSAETRYAVCGFGLLSVLCAAGLTLVRCWPEKPEAPGDRTGLGQAALAASPSQPAAATVFSPELSGPLPTTDVGSYLEADPDPADGNESARMIAPSHAAERPGVSEHGKIVPEASLAVSLHRVLPLVVAVWAAGVMFGLLRLGAGWMVLRSQIAGAEALTDSAWLERMQRLRQALRISRPVQVLQSAAAAVPVAAGWLRPVILLPTGMCSGLTIPQMEAILAHELAHIRRHDYLVNLLQCVADTLFFYHPAVRWISSVLRREREYCCDDAAAALCGGPLPYAGALARLEECRGSHLPAPAATGHSLLDRVRRLLGVPAPRPAVSVLPWFAGLLALLLLAVAAPVGLLRAGSGPDAPAENPASGEKTEAKMKTEPAPQETAAGAKPAEVGWDELKVTAEDESGQPIGEFYSKVTISVVKGEGDRSRSTTGSAHHSTQGVVMVRGDNNADWAYFEVQADGYFPQEVTWQSGQSTHIRARMKKAPVDSVRIVLPDGKPAAGARVLLGRRGSLVFVEGSGQLSLGGKELAEDVQGWMVGRGMGEDLERIVRCDAHGRAEFPLPRGDDVLISALHEEGVIASLSLNAALSEKKPLQLLRWASLTLDCGPGSNVLIADASVSSPGLRWTGRIAADRQGKAHWPRVMPGTLGWHVEYRSQPDENGRARRSAALAGREIAAGEQVSVTAQRQLFTGRLTGREDWSGVTILTVPDPGIDVMSRMHDPGPVLPGKDGHFRTEPLFFTGGEKFALHVMDRGNPAPVTKHLLPHELPRAGKVVDVGEVRVGLPPPEWLPKQPGQAEVRFRAIDAESGEALTAVQLLPSSLQLPEDVRAMEGVFTVPRQSSASIGTQDHAWTLLPEVRTGEITEVKLKRLPRVRGRLVDHTGRPVSGATIHSPSGLLRVGLSGIGEQSGWQGKTAADGSFDAPVRERYIFFTTENLRFWPENVVPGEVREIRLPEPGSLEVLLPADGTGSEITMTPLSGPRGSRPELNITVPATGANVLVSKLPPGKYHFWRKRTAIRQSGMSFNPYAGREVEIKAGSREVLDLRVPEGRILRGRVLHPEAAPPRAAPVPDWKELADSQPSPSRTGPVILTVMRPGAEPGREQTVEVRICDAAGTFMTDPLPAGTWQVIASSGRYSRQGAGQDLSDTQTITVQPGVDIPPLEFHLKPPAEPEPDAEPDEAFNEALARRLKRNGVWQVEKPCRECMAAAAKPNKEPPDQDEPFRKKLEAILKDAARVRPGMTRRELQTILAEEGGLSSVRNRQYPHRASPYIKLRVTFAPVAAGERKEHPEDKVLTVSEPFFQWNIMD